MQAESICANDIEGLDTDTFISVDYLPCDVSPRSRSQDAISIVELGKQLLLSAKNGDTETVRELMCRGAPFTTDWLGTSALHLAAQSNHTETAEILLRAGMSKDARTKVDKTPLHMAAYEGHYDMVQLLLYHGADVDSRDMLRMTPLHWAVEREHVKVMHILLEYGADVGAVSKFDKTPVSLALEHNRLDLVDLLQREREIIAIQAEQQNQANSTEIEVATQNLMQLEEVEEQQRFEMPQQSTTLKRKHTQSETKTRMIFQRIHVSQSNHGEQEKETENIETIEMNDITNSKKRKTSLGNINKQFRLLEAHGITMIPVEDESSIVENAMESGRTVVLTEAGKLALNSMKNSLTTKSFKIASRRGMVGKVITLKANPILSQNLSTVTSRAPNILKRSAVDNKAGKMRITIPTTTAVHISEANNLISSHENISLTSPTKISSTKLTEPIILQLDDEIEEVTEEENPDDNEPMTDIATLNKRLAEAQRLAAEYFKQYKKKEQEAEIYKQRLKTITAQRTSK